MFEKVIEPRMSETDRAGHINNTVIPVWFESGRDEIFKLFTPDLSADDWKMVIINFHVDFVHQLFYGKPVIVKTWIKEIGNTSLKVYEEIHQEGTLCARGEAVYVNFDLKKQKTERIPEDIRTILSLHLVGNQ
ncbi:acyl-CoA thioesterase [Mesobacillus maritimus]|uniref:Acyl-CoA thioesterase n=1 Tax=Mesobacillus maritimus TaxID=1643336 RepID=A0ABS7K0Y9_9BACI|nr:thioesterase family protein [Mesobacillus maritimus]MBY0095922.1 acyl-CoA thioesterase [Mesobacillus maritimus]